MGLFASHDKALTLRRGTRSRGGGSLLLIHALLALVRIPFRRPLSGASNATAAAATPATSSLKNVLGGGAMPEKNPLGGCAGILNTGSSRARRRQEMHTRSASNMRSAAASDQRHM